MNNKPSAIIMFDKKTGKKLKEYKSIMDAARDTGIPKSTIARQVKNKTQINQPVYFLYHDDNNDFYYHIYKLIEKHINVSHKDNNMKIEGEIWKGVIYQGVDYSWRFECSNMGRIRNALNGHIYTPHLGGIGYYQICTRVNDKNKNIKIHKAIAETFIPNPKNHRVVNHKDGNKQNNNVENLEWVTHKENSIHAIKLGLQPKTMNNNSKWIEKTCGESNNFAKLKKEDVIYIRKHFVKNTDGSTNKNELGKMFNTHPANIMAIVNHKTWNHI